MNNHVKNLKYICSILHDVRRGVAKVDISDEHINTLEFIYHELKENGEVKL